MIIDLIGRINGVRGYVQVDTRLSPKDLESLLNLKGGLTKDVTTMVPSFARRQDLYLGDPEIRGLWQISTPIMFVTILKASPLGKQRCFQDILTGLRNREDGVWWVRCIDEPSTISIPEEQEAAPEDPTFQDLLVRNTHVEAANIHVEDEELDISDADLALFLDTLSPGEDTLFRELGEGEEFSQCAVETILIPEEDLLEDAEVMEEEPTLCPTVDIDIQREECSVAGGSSVFGSGDGYDIFGDDEEILLLEEIEDNTPTIVLHPLTGEGVREDEFSEPLVLTAIFSDEEEVCTYIEPLQ